MVYNVSMNFIQVDIRQCTNQVTKLYRHIYYISCLNMAPEINRSKELIKCQDMSFFLIFPCSSLLQTISVNFKLLRLYPIKIDTVN